MAIIFHDRCCEWCIVLYGRKKKMKATIYKSRIDWWVWCVILVIVLTCVFVAIDTTWLVSLPICGFMLVCLLLIVGCWYEIRGDQLIIYQFFRPNPFPIEKIAEVKKTKGILATAGMSIHRVSIKFSDRSVLKSSMPLEISPKDRDGFIAQLKEINPSIVTKE